MLLSVLSFSAYAQDGSTASTFNRTVGASVFGSIQLVDTTPVVDPGVGGGLFFDYRFNQRFSLNLETFVTFQDGSGPSVGEGALMFFGVPTATLKIFLLKNPTKFDPYVGVGLGIYFVTEGNVANDSFGFGIGAQLAVGFDYYLSNRWSLGFEGTYRSIGLINKLSGTANATTFMPYTLLGRVGYHF